tara:strand:- start:211 stop:504 length:294 start_codon:yes stop_codon:yes gene_type:complete
MLIVTSIERAPTLSYFVKFFFRVILKDKQQKEKKMLTSKSTHIIKYNGEDDKFIEEQVKLIEERLRCYDDGLITKKEVMYDVTDSFFKIFARGANKS